jgi:hypothetical protein
MTAPLIVFVRLTLANPLESIRFKPEMVTVALLLAVAVTLEELMLVALGDALELR